MFNVMDRTQNRSDHLSLSFPRPATKESAGCIGGRSKIDSGEFYFLVCLFSSKFSSVSQIQ